MPAIAHGKKIITVMAAIWWFLLISSILYLVAEGMDLIVDVSQEVMQLLYHFIL